MLQLQKFILQLKLTPNYERTVIYVRDASKVAGVVSELLSPDNKDNFGRRKKKEYADLREEYLNNISETNYISLKDSKRE